MRILTMWLDLLLAVVGLILIFYGNKRNELFCIYTGIGVEIIAALVLSFIIIAL